MRGTRQGCGESTAQVPVDSIYASDSLGSEWRGPYLWLLFSCSDCVHVHLSNQITQNNLFMRLVMEYIYMHLRIMVTVNPYLHASEE